MNFSQAEAAMRAWFAGVWETPETISWPDLKFTTPNDQIWARFDCKETDGSQVSMGSPNSNRFRQFGILTIQIFQPEDQGSTEARSKAADVLTALKGTQTAADGVTFFDVSGRQVGNDGNGFYQINVVASFYYDEIT